MLVWYQYNHQPPTITSQPPASYIYSPLHPTNGFLQYHQPNRFQSLLLQPPQRRVQETLSGGAATTTNITPSGVPCFPLTFKVDLAEHIGKNGSLGCGGGGSGAGGGVVEDGLLCGSEQQQQ